MSLLIKDAAQRRRTRAPTALGLHPAVAERLNALGVNVEAFSAEVRNAQGAPRAAPARGQRLLAAAMQGAGGASARSASSEGRGGRSLALSLDPSDVRVTPLLNQAALLYEDNRYLADIVAPPQLVPERSAKYKIWDRGPFRQLIDSRIGPSASAKEVSATLSEDEYAVVGRALKAFALDDTELASPSIAAGVAAVEEVMELHQVQREYDVASAFHTTGNYPGANVRALGGTANWNGGVAADPVADVLYCLEQIPGQVTHCVMSDLVWHGAQVNDDLRAILSSQLENQGLLRPMDFGLYFGIPNVLITNADYRTDAGVRTRLWSTTGVWLGVVDERRDRRTFCRTFRLRQGAGGYVTKRWRDEDRGEGGGMWVRTAYAEARKIVSSDYGALITGARA